MRSGAAQREQNHPSDQSRGIEGGEQEHNHGQESVLGLMNRTDRGIHIWKRSLNGSSLLNRKHNSRQNEGHQNWRSLGKSELRASQTSFWKTPVDVPATLRGTGPQSCLPVKRKNESRNQSRCHLRWRPSKNRCVGK